MTKTDGRSIYINGAWHDADRAMLPVFDRAVLFADAIYEVLSVLDGRLLDFNRHWQRWERSLEQLGLPVTMPRGDWLALCRELIARNDLHEGTIYLQQSRGNDGDRDFLWSDVITPTLIGFTQARDLLANPGFAQGKRIIVRPDLRWGRCDIKTTQLLYASLMKDEARRAGVDDVWLERGGMITEGSSQNAHIITASGSLISRPPDWEILPGVTLIAMLECARAMGLSIEERPFSVGEAKAATEAFTSSASLFIMPVVAIDGHPIGSGQPGPVTAALRDAYISAVRASAL
jgi:D-alanine transaminase